MAEIRRSGLRDFEFIPSAGRDFDPAASPPTAGEMFNLQVGPGADFRRGLRNASLGLEAGSLFRAADQYETETQDRVGAEDMRARARAIQADTAQTQQRVSSFSEVKGVGDTVDYLQGGLGTLLPTMGPPMAGGAAGAIAGAALAGPLGIGPGIAAGVGGALGAAVPSFSMNAGEQAASQQSDEFIRENTTAEQRLREQNVVGGQNAALDVVFPAILGGRVVGGAARRIAGEALKRSPLRRTMAVARETGIEAGTELAQTITGQAGLTRLNPNRDTSHDYIEQIDAIILGALGGSTISLGTTVPGYAAERIGQRLNREADEGARQLGRGVARGRELLLRDLGAEVPLSQAGEGANVPLGIKPSLMIEGLSRPDAEKLDVLGERFAAAEGDPEAQEGIKLELNLLLESRGLTWDDIVKRQEDILYTGDGKDAFRVTKEGEPDTREHPDIGMLPEQPLVLNPTSTAGAAKFTKQYVRAGEEEKQLSAWVQEGFLPQEAIGAEKRTSLGTWLRDRRAAPEEVQAEADSMLRDLARRLENAKPHQKPALKAEIAALESAKTYGDYYEVLDKYTVMEFPPEVIEGRFTPQDAARQQRSTELVTVSKAAIREAIKKANPKLSPAAINRRVEWEAKKELEAERAKLIETQGIELKLEQGTKTRRVYKDDVVDHARNFFKEELKSFPDGPRRDEAALLMGVFADPRVKSILLNGKAITQADVNLENPEHRAALKLPPLDKPAYRGGSTPKNPLDSRDPEDRTDVDFVEEQSDPFPDAPVEDPIKVMSTKRLREEQRVVELTEELGTWELGLKQLLKTPASQIYDFQFEDLDVGEIEARAGRDLSPEGLKLKVRNRLQWEIKRRKNARSEAKRQVTQLTNKLTRYYDPQTGVGLVDKTNFPVTPENPVIAEPPRTRPSPESALPTPPPAGVSKPVAPVQSTPKPPPVQSTPKAAPAPIPKVPPVQAAPKPVAPKPVVTPKVNIASPFKGRGQAQIAKGVKPADVRLAAALTNVTFGEYQVDNVPGLKKPDPKGNHKLSAEAWYQANKTNDLAKDKAVMQQVIEAKLRQYPNLVKGITDRGGVTWIENAEHTVTGRGRWEGEGRQSNFLDVLAKAYEAVTGNETWREGLPTHSIDRNLKNKDGSKRLAATSKDGKIRVNPVATVEEFFSYFTGQVTGESSQQKAKVLAELAKQKWPKAKIRAVLNSADRANRFLVLHEQDHIDHGDRDVYWLQGDDLLTDDKIAIETRASKNALEKIAADPRDAQRVIRENIKPSRQIPDSEVANSTIYARWAQRLKERGLQILQDPDSEEYYVADKNGKRLDDELNELKSALNDIPVDLRYDTLEEALQDPEIQVRKEAATRWLLRAFGPEMLREDRLGWMLARDNEVPMAGFYEVANDFIKLAVDSLDPLSIAFHEGMHKFVKTLNTSGNQALYERLVKAATAPHVMKQMEKLLVDYPAAIDQIRTDPEEAVAYAFQFYAASREANGPTFRIQPSLKQFFRKIIHSLARVLGVMTHARASEQIFDALYSGKAAPAQGGLDALKQYRERTFKEYSQDALQTLKEAVPSVLSSPIIRLQNMSNDQGEQIQAFKTLANLFFSEPLKGGESGVIQRQSQMEGQYRNRWRTILQKHNVTKEQLKDTLLNFQSMREPRNEFEQDVKHFFERMYAYGQQGPDANRVKVLTVVDEATGQRSWLTPNEVKNYFPRIWSVENILANEIEFRETLQRYSKMTDEAITNFIDMLRATDGLEAGGELQRYRADFSPFQAAINARVFDFIKEDNAHEFAKFQEQDMVKIMDRYIRQAVHRREHSRTFGYDGKGIDDLLKQAKAEGATPQQIAFAEKAVKGLEGRLGTDKVSDVAREAQVTAMSLVNFAVLPLALFSSMVDPLGVMVRTGSMKQAFNTYKTGIKQIVNDARKEKSVDQKLTEYLGIIEEDMAQDILNNTERGMFMNEKLRQVNQFFFKSIGLEQWTRGTRIGAMRAGIEYLKKNADNIKALDELGLTPADIQLFEDRIKVKPEEFKTGKKPTDADIEQARRVQNALYRMVDESILRPSAGTRPLWMSDMRFLLLGHLKQFTFTFHNTIIRQLLTKAGNQEDMARAALVFMPLLSYVPVMIAADAMRDAVRGKDDDDEDKSLADIVLRAVQRSSILGLGTFLMDVEDDADYGQLPVNTLLGPVIDSALNVGGAAIDPDRSLVRAWMKLLPYNAMWRNWGDDE